MKSPVAGSQDTNSSPGERWHEERVHRPSDVTTLGDRVTGLMAQAGYAEKDLFAMRLALEEAVVNGLRHGNGNDPSKAVHVRFQVSPERVLTEIEDQGAGFNPGAIPDPLAPENLENPSGRGIFLIRHYMTWVKFNDRGNCISFCKERS